MFDLRIPIGWFFLALGAMLLLSGFLPAGPAPALAPSGINLRVGALMCAFGFFMLATRLRGSRP
jgi:hypothetical protein